MFSSAFFTLPDSSRGRIPSMLKLKRVYEAPKRSDGTRVLVDRVWPRGMSKERAKLAVWLKDIAPSTALRKWFGHDPKRWSEFQKRYRRELQGKREAIVLIRELESKRGLVTLVYSARDEQHNQAVALLDLLTKRPFRKSA